jgi:manganese oxidase
VQALRLRQAGELQRRVSMRTVSVVSSLGIVVAIGLSGCQASGPSRATAAAEDGQVRRYFIGADEVVWDYAPAGMDRIKGRPFDAAANVFVAGGPRRIGRRYVKAVYQEYTDGSFVKLKRREGRWDHLGLLGPLVRASVGDTIELLFRNNTRFPASVHPHGVFYDKASEGVPYDDGTGGLAKADDAIAPGATSLYRWSVPERAGPGPHDGSSVFWMYHSHVDEIADTNAGLIGPMIVTARGRARPDGTPADVDRELIANFMIVDENQSPYLPDNVARFAPGAAGVDPDADDGFRESNLMHAINGYVNGNLPALTMRQGERVRWYLMAMGSEIDLHTPHWHGNTVVLAGMRTDVASLLPAAMAIADMRPDAPGRWLFHCHVNDHLRAGMIATYVVEP